MNVAVRELWRGRVWLARAWTQATSLRVSFLPPAGIAAAVAAAATRVQLD